MADDSDGNTPPAPAPKQPATTRRRTPRKTSTEGTSRPRRKTAAATTEAGAPAEKRKPAKPRATTRSAPAKSARKPAKRAPKKSGVKADAGTGSDRNWGTTAAVVGGIAAVGAAATAALLSLRGSTPRPAIRKAKSGHSPTGEDASASVTGAIADQNAIPDES
jgi:hypothetical protein